MGLPAVLLFVLVVGAMVPSAADEAFLARYEWTHRPLLVFASHSRDPRVESFLERLALRDCALRDRNMVVGLLVEEGVSRMEGDVLSATTAAAIRERYRIGEGEFAVILVGKDGGEKLRDTKMPQLDEIFGLIDGMPMRRNEMLTRQNACEE